MERIPFKLVITGDVSAYNQEHAADIIEEVVGDMRNAIHASRVTKVLQTGDNIRDICTNIDLPFDAGKKEIESYYKDFIREILKDLEEVIPKPPALFDKTDYIKTRNIILERIVKWKRMDETWGWNNQKQFIEERARAVARSVVIDYYKGLTKEIIAAAVTENDTSHENGCDE